MTTPIAPAARAFHFIRLRMAGATIQDRMLACVGAFVGILSAILAAWISGLDGTNLSLLVAPIGASAVLVFAVPSSPLAQPWSVMGGNGLSALTGLLIAFSVPEPVFAMAAAVSLAILVMTFTRSLHPPGGASALTMVIVYIATPTLAVPTLFLILLNSAGLVGVALLFHRVQGRSYPHRPLQSSPETNAVPTFDQASIRAAVLEMGDAFDVTEADLTAIFERAAKHAQKSAKADFGA